MAQAVLHITQQQSPRKSRQVEHKDQHHGLLRLKTNHLLGINGRQRDGHGHPALIGHRAGQQTGEITVWQSLAQGLPQAAQTLHHRHHRGMGPRGRVLAQQGQSHQGRRAIHGRCDPHRHRHELATRLATGLRRQHISQTNAQSQHAADVAQRPTPTADTAHGIGLGQFGQKRGGERLAIRKESVGHHQDEQTQSHLTWPHQRQGRRAQHATQADPHQHAFFAGHPVGPGTQPGHGEHDDQIRQAQARCPSQRGPFGPIGHAPHKIGRKNGRDHHGGVARVGEVVHGPAKDLAQAHAWIECRTKTQGVHAALSVQCKWRGRRPPPP